MNETRNEKRGIYSDESAAALRGGTASPEFQTLHEIVKKARQNLDQNDWDYIVGGTESETTLRRNRMALDALAFRPRVLRDVSRIDAAADRFGRRLRLPVVLAPVGALEVFHQGGGATAARAAEEFGVAHMLSAVCEPGLEAGAGAGGEALGIYQLYVRGDAAYVDDHVRRAMAKGYAAFCLAVDTAVYSRRERDLAKRFVTAGRRRVSGREFQAALDWRTVARIKQNFEIPLALKGIATREDAVTAVEHGVDWIYVSNHGGRQLDHGLGAMEMLPEIVEAVGGRAKIMIDGAFCRGPDIVKAVIFGAHLVGLRRMQCFALAAARQAGGVRLLELRQGQAQRCLRLLRATRFAELHRSYVRPAAPANPPHALRAFPLLQIEDYRYC